ncbi:chymotrypsin-1-like isoform X2 [Spodoptera litura]|uniref:Chymotrypsin-1-like isoform X2 n=1 Tax=Spodoptera litura TaxID=69820 RepID=A0A9J7ITU9_SPOLT|nr:chymotrypsin-1-like isoform X2 [Spodoptera litura]
MQCLAPSHGGSDLRRDGKVLPLWRTLRVTVGSYQWKSGIVYDVAGNVSHPSYDNINVKHDIGILITTTNVALNDLVQLVPITYDYIGAGVQVVFAGWGVTSDDGTESHELMEMRTSTIDGADCMIRVARATLVLQMPYYVPPLDPHVEVCTLQPTGLGICGGDSGSALRRASDGHQFGIASWLFHCALGAPDMYVRISSYQNWLRSVIV